MKNTGNQDAAGVVPVEHDMAAVFHAPQARAYFFTGPAQLRIVCELPATRFEIVNIANGLVLSPGVQGVAGDVHKVGLGTARKTERGHG